MKRTSCIVDGKEIDNCITIHSGHTNIHHHSF